MQSQYRVDGTHYGFALPAGYDRSRPLVIDPGLAYSTFLGGGSSDSARGVAVDAQGSAYVICTTASTDFPVTTGAYDTDHNGGAGDLLVTKLTPDGSTLAYSTFIGGTNRETAARIAVDAVGNAYVTGSTLSPDFPTTPGAYDTSHNGFDDGFAAKLAPNGASLAYSTFLGGSQADSSYGIAVDMNGSAYLAGETGSTDFPLTPEAFDTSLNGSFDGFVAKLSPSGAALDYATLAGGASDDSLSGIAVDSNGSAYVAGFTYSPDFPTTSEAFDRVYGGDIDAIVAKLTPSGGALTYATFLGGDSTDDGRAIAVDAQGAAYVTGMTRSPSFATTPGAHDRTHTGDFDEEAFVTKLAPSGSGLAYSTLLGDVGNDNPNAIAVDDEGFAYVTGRTAGPSFPTTADAYDRTLSGGLDAFVTKLAKAGTAIVYSTYLGGTTGEFGQAIALDQPANAYVAGGTTSPDFPVTAAPADGTYGEFGDGFVAKLRLVDDAPTEPSAVQERTLELTAPTVLSLQLGPAPSLGSILPGAARDYQATMSATATVSTDGARLTVADLSAAAPGHLINGPAVLTTAVRARADSLDGAVSPFADVGGASSPTTLVTYPDQTSNDPVTLTFLQHVGVREKVRAGTYSKTLTFTLSATAP